MRPAKPAKESDEDKLKREIDEDFEKAISEHMCCINSIEREIAETKSMKISDGSGKSWERIRVKLDSGAIDWVFTPEAGEAFETKPSIFSRYGINYTAANGTEIENFGQKTLTGYSDEWTPLSVNV